MILVFATAAGFVAAGLVTSFYQWVAARPLRIVMGGGTAGITAATLLWVVTGPLIILRAVFSEAIGARSMPAWIAAGAVAAALWSCCLGILIIGLVLTVT